jgi:hypothetical protein
VIDEQKTVSQGADCFGVPGYYLDVIVSTGFAIAAVLVIIGAVLCRRAIADT